MIRRTIALTGKSPFGVINADQQELFAVRAGLPVAAALEQASCLLHTVEQLTTDMGMDEQPSTHCCWAAYYLTQMASAIVNAVVRGADVSVETLEGDTP